MDLNNEWDLFLSDKESAVIPETYSCGQAPTATPIYISTNTIISFLNQPIDLRETFWKIPIIPYNTPTTGVIKKQMKFNSTSKCEVDEIDMNVESCEYGYSTIIQHIENEKGMIKYKDVRKVTIGVSKKDIISYRVKPKGAFYNCFVIIVRVQIDGVFKEFHVKIFNTGKIEIPGIQKSEHIGYVVDLLLSILCVYYPTLTYNKSCEETVLINSNFNCGYFINRAELYQLLKFKYNISAVYDPCSYPGIQCKIYYQNGVVTTIQSISVSFMIFRTGSILIVGKCSKEVIYAVYHYLTTILLDEYADVVSEHNGPYVKKEISVKKLKKYILFK